MKLEIIIASTRPGRLGGEVGKWVAEYATATTKFEVAVADLAEINLPLFDEPNLPMMGQYTKDHTKAWSKRIDAADAVVVVTPEYNYTMPPSLLNAIDYLHSEWKRKPVGFVGYGIIGAARAIQAEKLLFANLSAMPMGPTVNLMNVYSPAMTTFTADDKHEQAAGAMLAELEAWATTLAPLRKG